jgi:hypothetical protein
MIRNEQMPRRVLVYLMVVTALMAVTMSLSAANAQETLPQ